jgi:NAD(P) transhydrogenase
VFFVFLVVKSSLRSPKTNSIPYTPSLERGIGETMSQTHYDLLVIGTGPAGEGASMKAAKSGKSVAVIEKYVEVGGGCTHWGTIPSKALRQVIYHLNTVHQNPIYRQMEVSFDFSLPQLIKAADRVIRKQVDLRQGFYERNNVRLIHGSATFVDPHTLAISRDSGLVENFTADGIIIGTGSRPYRPANVDFSHPRILDSDTLLDIKFTPKSVTIFGAGVLACEYASMLSNLGMEINLIDTRNQLLSFLDEEISDALSYHFADRNINVRHNEEFEGVEALDDCVIVHLKSGKKIRSDVLLWSNGRSGNSEGLNLASIGVQPNSRGQIEVNENFQVKINASLPRAEGQSTDQAVLMGGKNALAKPPEAREGQPIHKHIYCAGDIIGAPSLASASYDQGRFAATHFCLGDADYRLVQDIPTGIYTSPEISSLGKTEAQLTAEKVPYEVGKAQFKTLARAQITGQTAGMLKILFHRETLQVLGIHCFGDQAAEIIHIGQAIMLQPHFHNTIRYFANTTFNYPTMAEAYRVAALNGLDRVF